MTFVEAADPILFMCVVLIIGIWVIKVGDYFHSSIPYTVIMFTIGIIFASGLKEHDQWGDSINQWANIEPDILLFVFLPPLVAGEAMSVNWFHWLGSFWDSMILAGPGVLVGAFTVGSIARAMLPYEWSFYLAMVLGSVLAATDTAAVVAILSEVKGSPKLTMMIVGESLLNDATAMVLFNIFFSLLAGTTYSTPEIIGLVANSFLGSVAFGCGSGLVHVYLLRMYTRRYSHQDSMMQIAFSISWAYLDFFVAQNMLNQSGVLAVVSSGLMYAWLAPPIILNPAAMEHVWSLLEWFCNTMLFLLAGLKLGAIHIHTITVNDWGYMFALYFIMMGTRASVLAVFFPVLRRVGYRVSVREMIFVAWAGMRGALSIALVLTVDAGKGVTEEDSTRLFFYVGGVTACTLLINATTAESLLLFLGLIGDKSVEMTTSELLLKRRLRRRLNKVAKELEEKHHLNGRETQYLVDSCSLLKDEQLVDIQQLQRQRTLTRGLDSARGIGSGQESGHRQESKQATPKKQRSVNPVKETSVLSSPSRGDMREWRGKDESSSRDDDGTPPLLHHDAVVEALETNIGIDAQFMAENSEEEIEPEGDTRPRDKRAMTLARLLTPYDEVDMVGAGDGDQSGMMSVASVLSGIPTTARTRSVEEFNIRLAQYHRTVLLEITRAHYWRDIGTGKLPRPSFAARCLLYSADVGLDEIDVPGADWKAVKSHLERHPWYVKVMYWVGRLGSLVYMCGFMSRVVLGWLAMYETEWEKRVTYTVTAFIDAHEYARERLHKYAEFSQLDGVEQPVTREEQRVLSESEQSVKEARAMLLDVPDQVLRELRLKQVSGILLAREAQMVEDLAGEGIMSAALAEEIFEDIEHDNTRLEKDKKNAMKALGQARRRASGAPVGTEGQGGLDPGKGISSSDLRKEVRDAYLNYSTHEGRFDVKGRNKRSDKDKGKARPESESSGEPGSFAGSFGDTDIELKRLDSKGTNNSENNRT